MSAPKAHKNTKPAAQPVRLPHAPVMHFGDIKLDMLIRQLTVGGRSQKLSPKEFPLLYALVSHAGEFVSRGQLCAAMDSDCEDTSLENQLYRLRKKLRGSGYRIVAERGRGHRLEKVED